MEIAWEIAAEIVRREVSHLIDRLNAIATDVLNPSAVRAQFTDFEWMLLFHEFRHRPDARWSDNALVVMSAWRADH